MVMLPADRRSHQLRPAKPLAVPLGDLNPCSATAIQGRRLQRSLSTTSCVSYGFCLTDKWQTIGGGSRLFRIASSDRKNPETLGQRSPAAPRCLLPASF